MFFCFQSTYSPTSIKGPKSVTPLFLFACESLTITFSSEHVETKEITVRVLKIIKHTSGTQPIVKNSDFASPCNTQ